MATTIKFTKMQGTGNDYIYVNTLSSPLQDPIKAARKWSAYHTGIGADGLVLIGASEKADFSMRIFNADGSEAMMCGNASRCIGKYVYEKGLTDKEVITLETLSGIKILKLHTGNGVVKDVTVDMGTPLLSNPGQIATKTGGMLAETIPADGKEYKGTFVCMGNPHVVIALAKGVVLSLVTVFTFMPALTLVCYPWMDKTHHKPLLPGFDKFGRFVSRIMLPAALALAVIMVPSYLASNNNEYYYGAAHMFGTNTRLGADTAAIEETFGKSDTWVVLVPEGDTATQAELSASAIMPSASVVVALTSPLIGPSTIDAIS